MERGNRWQELLAQVAPGTPLGPLEAGVVRFLHAHRRAIAGLDLELRADGLHVCAYTPGSTGGPTDIDPSRRLDLARFREGALKAAAESNHELAEASLRLELRLRVFAAGPNDPATLENGVQLAIVMGKAGERPAAIELLEGLCAAAHAHRDRHAIAQKAMARLAYELYSAGRLEEAERTQERVHRAAVARHGVDHPDSLAAANVLALIAYWRGDPDRAREMLDATNPALARAAEAGVAAALQPMALAANLREALGDPADALLLRRGAAEIALTAHAPDDPRAIEADRRLGETLFARGDLAGAAALQASVYTRGADRNGREHPETLRDATRYAATLDAQGARGEALAIRQAVLDAQARTLGSEHVDTIATGITVAAALMASGQARTALDMQGKLYDTAYRVLGPSHRHTLGILNNVANAAYAAGESAQAVALLRAAIPRLIETHGAAHPAVLRALGNLMLAFAKAEAWPDSLRCAHQLLALLADAHGCTRDTYVLAARIPLVRYAQMEALADRVAPLVPLLVRLSRAMVRSLGTFPRESIESVHGDFERFHRGWLAFCAHRAPQDALAALSPLHGLRSWTAIERAIDSTAAAAPESAMGAYRARTEALVQLRVTIDDLEARIAATRARIDRYPQGERARDALERELEALESRHGESIGGLDRELSVGLERAETALRREAPAIHAQWEATRGVGAAWVDAHLDEDEALLALFEIGGCTVAYLQRRALPVVWVALPAFEAFTAACERFCEEASAVDRGAMRGARDGSAWPAEVTTLEAVRELARERFWRPIAPQLHGVSGLHLVTGPGQHDLLFECGRPPELEHVRVSRYCGLPAYRRRLMDAASDEAPHDHVAFIHDQAWDTAAPTPFTALDAFVPAARGFAQPQRAESLALEGPAAPSVIIASHGDTVGAGRSQSGILLVGEHRIDPSAVGPWSRPIARLVSLSCFGGRVGGTPRGDAHGALAAFQLAGLRFGIACVAPVPDFLAPLFGAILWDDLLRSDCDPRDALHRAKRRLRDGPWEADLRERVLDPLRDAYRSTMREVLERVRFHPEDAARNARALPLLRSLRGWTLPAKARRALDRPDAALADLHASFSRDHCEGERADALIEGTLETLFAGPARWRADRTEDRRLIDAIEALCAVTLFFGRGNDPHAHDPHS